eukprot:scaffold347_cov239-Pinguiococcus_pyrenoidosus.AAC.48
MDLRCGKRRRSGGLFVAKRDVHGPLAIFLLSAKGMKLLGDVSKSWRRGPGQAVLRCAEDP